MNTKKALKISLVIPVYNEESHLADCLRSAIAQQLPFTEIIVVDNNSTDSSAAIARSFAGVQVVTEAKQGVVHARNTGFNRANSDIIARIDADTVLPHDWTQQLQSIFKNRQVAAVTGRMEYSDMAATKLCNRIDLVFRRYLARHMQETALQAANMGIRRSVWMNVQSQICDAKGMHEDLCLGVHAQQLGHKVVFDERLVATIAFRQADSAFLAFCAYTWLNPKTYRLHGLTSQRYIYPIVLLAIACYVPLRVLHQGYDATTGKFSWRKLFQYDHALAARVNPATYVD